MTHSDTTLDEYSYVSETN